MTNEEMMNHVKEAFLDRLDNDFSLNVCEIVWAKIFRNRITVPNGVDASVTELFDECFNELRAKIVVAFAATIPRSLTLEEAVLKYFGPGGQFFTPEAAAFLANIPEIRDIECDSCCGSGILALVWRTANDAQSYEGSERAALWGELIYEAKVIYHG